MQPPRSLKSWKSMRGRFTIISQILFPHRPGAGVSLIKEELQNIHLCTWQKLVWLIWTRPFFIHVYKMKSSFAMFLMQRLSQVSTRINHTVWFSSRKADKDHANCKVFWDHFYSTNNASQDHGIKLNIPNWTIWVARVVMERHFQFRKDHECHTWRNVLSWFCLC